jgi:hypothetical protein
LIFRKPFTPEENVLELLEKSPDPWVSEDTFAVKIFIKDNISHYFLRRDLLPEQELLEEQQAASRCAARRPTRTRSCRCCSTGCPYSDPGTELAEGETHQDAGELSGRRAQPE